MLLKFGETVSKKRNGEGFIRLKPGRKSLWEIRVSVLQEDGTKKQRTFYASSKEAADARLDELRTLNKQGRLRPKTPPTLGKWLDEWLGSSLPIRGLKASTEENYRYVFRGVLQNDEILASKLDSLTASDLEKLMARIARQGLGTSTQRIALTLIKKALDTAQREGHITNNPCAFVTRPVRDDTSRTKWLELKDVAVILNELKDSVYLAPAIMLTLSGMRRGEVLALTWQDVDFANERLFIRSTLNRVQGNLEVSSPKTSNSRRTIHLTPEMDTLLSRLKANSRGTTDFVFVGSTGEPVEPRNMLRAFKAAASKAGFPEANLHSLRHAAASQMLNNGVPLFTVSKTLGHSSIAITADTYGHLEDEAQKRAIRALSGQVLETVMAQNSGTLSSDKPRTPALASLLTGRPLVPQTSALPSCATARRPASADQPDKFIQQIKALSLTPSL